MPLILSTILDVLSLIFGFVGENIIGISAAIAAFATIAIALFTLALKRVARTQANISNRGVGVAETSAESYRNVERAYMQMSHFSDGGAFRLEDTADGKKIATVRMQIKNYGNTPGTVTGVSLIIHQMDGNPDSSWGKPLPGTPPYMDRPRQEREIFLVPNNVIEWPKTFGDDPIDVAAAKRKEIDIYVLGCVEYTDKFGDCHRAGYARWYDPNGDERGNNLSWVTETGYNYDSVRDCSEGKSQK